jgi:hypothetical protein
MEVDGEASKTLKYGDNRCILYLDSMKTVTEEIYHHLYKIGSYIFEGGATNYK